MWLNMFQSSIHELWDCYFVKLLMTLATVLTSLELVYLLHVSFQACDAGALVVWGHNQNMLSRC